MAEQKLAPTDIKLHQKSRVLDISFNDGKTFNLSCEYLRCFSPSAEVRGHAPGQEVLQVGKQNVNIMQIEPVGTYAVVLHFDDEHNTGIYTWPYLYELGVNQEKNWQSYLDKLMKAGIEKKV